MTKKTIMLSVALASALNANQLIVDFIEKQVPKDIKVNFVSKEADQNLKGIEINYLNLTKDSQTQEVIVFNQGTLMFNDIIDLERGESYKKLLLDTKLAKAVAPFITKEDSEKVISINSKNKNAQTVYIFTDPFCSHCQNYFKNIDKILEEKNLKIIMVPILGVPSQNAVAAFYEEAHLFKTDEEKVKLLSKYFNLNPEEYAKSYNPLKVLEIQKFANKYQAAGLRGVPTILSSEYIKE